MAPIIIFDKSFLQSLTVDESVWLDNYFISNICPLFYSETLADLSKSVKEGRTPENEVRIISNKTPQMKIAVNVFHQDLCHANLNGYEIKMDGRPLIPGGKPVQSENKKGFVFEPSPETKAFERWQNEEFLELEREYAKLWREATEQADFNSVSERLNQFGIKIPRCNSLQKAKDAAEEILNTRRDLSQTMSLIFTLLNEPPEYFFNTLYSWRERGCPPIKVYAPYVYHVLTVELFFYIAIESNLISAERKSNKIDISYLFYTPFCQIFISSDKLHKRCAPLFLSEKQKFIWGIDLKADLKNIDLHFDQLPKDEKELGLHVFASYPPLINKSIVVDLWDQYCPIWRELADKPRQEPKHIDDTDLPQSIKKFTKGRELKPSEVDFDIDQADAMALKRMVSQKKGKWYQIGKQVEIKEENLG
ncbi:MAG: hypothetical protein D3905_04580 [Candidatus Electrothrix sp. AS4_5]|nr:hypothetical protein [Candidatus Electrothrix gigas]